MQCRQISLRPLHCLASGIIESRWELGQSCMDGVAAIPTQLQQLHTHHSGGVWQSVIMQESDGIVLQSNFLYFLSHMVKLLTIQFGRDACVGW